MLSDCRLAREPCPGASHSDRSSFRISAPGSKPSCTPRRVAIRQDGGKLGAAGGGLVGVERRPDAEPPSVEASNQDARHQANEGRCNRAEPFEAVCDEAVG